MVSFKKTGFRSLAWITLALAVVIQGAAFSDAKSVFSGVESAVLKKKPGYVFVSRVKLDINKDGKTDEAFLIGKKFDKTSMYYVDFKLGVIDGKTKTFVYTSLPEDRSGGYAGDIKLADLTGDGRVEITLNTPTGGSGGIVNFFAYKYYYGESFKLIFDADKISSKYADISGMYKDNYKVDVNMKGFRKVYTVDVSGRKDIYDEMKVYKDGKLLQKIVPWGGAAGLVKVVDVDDDKVYEIVYTTAINGTMNADDIGLFEITWKYEKGRFVAKGIRLLPVK